MQRLPVALLGLGALFVIGLSSLHALLPQYQSSIVFGATCIAGLATLLTACYVGATLADTNARERREHAFEFSRLFSSDAMVSHRARIREAIELGDEKGASLAELADKDKDLEDSLKVSLGFFEELAIAVSVRHVDEEVAYRFFGQVVPWAAENLKCFIDAEQLASEDARNYAELVTLAQYWADHKSVLTEKALGELAGEKPKKSQNGVPKI